ncbi:MAG: competence/damage-inducible protein A, partial [Clostridia bacterium]|nr:competence/damage-inducible protein A [Clostridia bacterium]
MKCEILSVGTELLYGQIQDTNATFLARTLREAGFDLRHRQTCGDDRAELAACLTLALSRSDAVLVTGGLGPTYDDVTRDAVSAVTGRKLVRHEETVSRIRAFFQRRGRDMKDNNLLQALVPEGAEVLPNDYGTAPGIWLETEGKILVLMPGVPREMKGLMRDQVMPKLSTLSGKGSCCRILRLFGITESELDTRIPEKFKNGADPAAAPFAGDG